MSFSGTRGEGFGKLHIKVLLTQGYSGENALQFGWLCASADQWIENIYKHDKDDSLLKKRTSTILGTRTRERKEKKCKFFCENLFNFLKGFQC